MMDLVVSVNVQIDCVAFTPLKTVAAIKTLKSNQSSGPDGLVPLLFKKLSQLLADPLSLLYTAFMSVSRIPKACKKATVTPVGPT